MRIFLIRHAETEHNVAQVYAGTTDSALTNHGVLQIEHLAQHFATKSIHFNTIFASDLSRARLTAEGICRLQPQRNGVPLTPILTPDLREKDFGSLENVRWQASNTASPGNRGRPENLGPASAGLHIESETNASMRQRATSFLNGYFLPLMLDASESEDNVAIVAHGIILRVLWNCLVGLFDPMHITLTTGTPSFDNGPAALVTLNWSNTGYTKLWIQPPSQQKLSLGVGPDSELSDNSISTSNTSGQDYLLNGWTMRIIVIDSKDHLAGLRRTRGGIGSAAHDTRQRRIEQFFKQ
ncbi:hypothetical protein N7495_002511 [Penicillium taxi]|uniref:uncharacterized protein n=1 Tax=Penicillium taxi TaxID=168475 RepID=UPI002544EDA7|nr:uncharacterized protein N7495_002511 [Penicillium taxi]KAJ5901983.1 hypothetical protein N7495_002511 [Penicillium taxi]